MTKIIIAAPSYNDKSGGSIALHKLCHVLNNLEYDAYVCPTDELNYGDFYCNPKYNTKVAERHRKRYNNIPRSPI